jgi:predicted nucleic acid-binding protein
MYVTVGELIKWTVARKWGAPRRTALETWLARFPVLPANADVGRKWGEVVAYAEQRGRPRPVNDSWIAAACLATDLGLATLNVADFQDFADYEGLELITVDPRP